MSNKLGLVSPWINYYKMVNALFEKDPEVTVSFDNESYELAILVNNDIKADAIRKLFPEEKEFGNVVVKINVVPSNEEESAIDLYRRAFAGNPAVVDITGAGPLGNNFVIFAKEVVQYYNDSLTDAYGYRSTLYEIIADELFGLKDNIYFSTEVTPED